MVAPLRLTPALGIVTALAIAAPARAQDDAPPPEATAEIAPAPPRPFFVSLGIGAAVRLDGFVPAAFRIVEELGVHLDGTEVGPFVALTIAEDASPQYSMHLGARVGWDLELVRQDFSLVISPSAAIAFAFDIRGNDDTWAYFLVQPALGVSLLLLDRMLGIWVRPIGVDIYIGEQVHGGWAALAGATLSFGG